jgi:hypothetical protein
VHTSTELRSDHFTITVAGQPASIDSLFPGFTLHDRLGIVLVSDWAGAGASTVVLAAVTAFYDRLRAEQDEFFAYPDYFSFHVGGLRGSLHMLDVFPEHKEVVVDPEPEQILRAINDRGVTRLLVEAAQGGEPVEAAQGGEPRLESYTRASAERRILTALAYSPAGRVPDPDVLVTGSAKAESYVAAMLGPATEPLTARAALLQGDRPVESFRRITVDQALRSLTLTRSAPADPRR